MRVRLAGGLALAGVVLLPGAAHALDVEVLRQAGPIETRFNIAVLGDGYRAQDQAQLSTDAKKIVTYVLGVSPFKEYAQFFNVKLVHVISNDNGADNGSYGAVRDTALDTDYGCGGIARLLCVNETKAKTIAATEVPEFNFALVIVNDPMYGGSGGSVCTASSNPMSFEVVSHEIGHSLAGLADEYDTPGNQPPCPPATDCREPNVTLRSARNLIKWAAWIDAATPVPTPATATYAKAVGLFQGARYLPTGVYRPFEDCKMRELNQPYCPVCTEAFVLTYWNFENIKMIESATPATATVESATCDAVSFGVGSPPLTPSTYRYTWTVDGALSGGGGATLTLSPGALGMGAHEIEVVVEDTTTFVRDDPKHLLRDVRDWTFDVMRADCPADAGVGDATGGGGGGGAAGANGGAGTGDAGSGAAGADAAGGGGTVAATDGAAGSATGAPPQQGGCGCSVPGSPHGSGAGVSTLLALATGIARRRRGATRTDSGHAHPSDSRRARSG